MLKLNLDKLFIKFKKGNLLHLTGEHEMGFIFGPSWFYGIDSGFSFFAMLVTISIAIFSLKAYFIAKDRKYLYFTLAFFSISVSYLIKAVASWVVFKHILGKVPNLTAAISTVVSMPNFYSLGYILYVFFIFAGFMILVAIYLRIHSIRTLSLLFILMLILSILSQSKFIAFHVTLFLLLFYIVIHLFKNHIRTKSVSTFLVLYSMLALMVSQIFYFFIIFDKIYYVIGHVLQLIGFLLLLLNMILVFRKR